MDGGSPNAHVERLVVTPLEDEDSAAKSVRIGISPRMDWTLRAERMRRTRSAREGANDVVEGEVLSIVSRLYERGDLDEGYEDVADSLVFHWCVFYTELNS